MRGKPRRSTTPNSASRKRAGRCGSRPRRSERFHSVVHDFEPGFDTYTEKPGYRVQADLGLDEVVAEEYHGLVLPGGRAPEYLRNRPKAVSIVRHFLETGKPIAANCHGPLLLLAAGNVKGRTMTCYPELEPDIKAAGAEFRQSRCGGRRLAS